MNLNRSFAPALVALTLAFSNAAMTQAQTSAPAEAAHHHRTRAEWDAVMQQRLAMIEALEVTHDDSALAALLKDDKALENYAVLLRRAAGYLHDPQLLEKLLDFPALDKNSPQYIHAVGGIFAEITANTPKPEEVKLAAMMFERIKNDKAMLNDALRFIFETSAMFYGKDTPDVGLTKLLIANGANLNDAVVKVTEEIMSGSHRLLQGHADERLARMEKFKAAIAASDVPQPAPQTFAPKG